MKTVVDSLRGCGWRTPGALYLRSDGHAAPCGRLPIPLTVCPCCGQGIKQARGFTWITNEIFLEEDCKAVGIDGNLPCQTCPLGPERIPKKLGLLWVGARFYPDPNDFLRESSAQGISKRIAQIPKDLVLGETLVALAHPSVTIRRPELGDDPLECQGPAIFSTFVPTRIEYIVTGEETDEELDRLEDRGVTLVLVERSETQPIPNL